MRILPAFDRRLTDEEACKLFFGKGKELVRLPNAVHTATFIPTRGGKGASLIVPFLLNCRDSVVCIDYKSELAGLTAEYRAAMGQEIVTLDPYGTYRGKLPWESATLNGIEFCRDTDGARDIAKSLVKRDEKEHGTSGHFSDWAEKVIAAAIAVTVTHGGEKDKNLAMVKKIITNAERRQMAFDLMKKSGGELEQMADEFDCLVGEERGSVYTSAFRHTGFLNSEAVVQNSMATSFDMANLKRGVTIYICPSMEHSKVMEPWVRMVIGVLLKAVMREGLGEERKIHFMFDESASMGHMDIVDDLVDKGAGFGMRGQWYFQSVGQVSKNFPGQEQTFLSNVIQIFAAVNDMGMQGKGTAEYVSSRLGPTTVLLESGGTSHQTSISSGDRGERTRSRSSTRNDNWSQHKRELATADEVLRFPQKTAVTFVAGLPPIKTTLIRWFENREIFKRRGIGERFVILLRALSFLILVGFAIYLLHWIAGETRLFERLGAALQKGRWR